MKKNYCMDCLRLLSKPNAKRCWHCYLKWRKTPKNHPNYKGDKALCRQKYYCVDCNKILSNYRAKRCFPCSKKGELNSMFGRKRLDLIIRNKLNPLKKEYNPNYKDGRTLKKHYCIDCGIEIELQSALYGQRRCKSCSKKGKRNKNYINGKGYEPYTKEFNNKLKELIRKRDNYTCQVCDMIEEEHLIVYGINLCVHHIDYNKNNCNKENLISLCNKCNLRVNSNRDYWFAYFMYVTGQVI